MPAPVIDCQVHAYEKDSPQRPWVDRLHGPAEVTGDDMVAAMDAVGVDGALLVSPYTMYRYDASYALEVYDRHPDRFGLIKPFDRESESIDEELEDWASKPGVVGARAILSFSPKDEIPSASDPGLNRILAKCGDLGLPVNVLCWGSLALLGELAVRNPDTQLVIDHIGMLQPFEPPPPQRPFRDLKEVLAQAAHANVAIKLSGAGTLSKEPFPYPDIWPPLLEVIEAYGLERCMWGTDWTRAIHLLTYEQGVEAFRQTGALSDADREALMGGTLSRIYDWQPGG